MSSAGTSRPPQGDYETAWAIATAASEALDLPEPASLEGLRRHLEHTRGRSIAIRELARCDDSRVCGLWFRLDDLDVIFHAAATQGLHREQIILHEFGHMLLNHDAEEFRAEQVLNVFPDLDSSAVLHALQRGRHGSQAEMAAEILADLLAERIRTSRRTANRLRGFDEVFG